jgi:SAM-dependent methyltransferase
MKLNLGCGAHVPEGWLNVDYSLGARVVKIPFFRRFNRAVKLFSTEWDSRIYLHDLTTKFPWGDGSCDFVYSSHTLEHLSKEEGRRFLEECHRVLRSEGVIRIVVPDLQYQIGEYVEGRVKADLLLEKLGVLYGYSKAGWKQRLAPFFEFPHKCMYDNTALVQILKDIGFATSSRAAFDSEIPDIRVIELDDRTVNAVIVEGKKGT